MGCAPRNTAPRSHFLACNCQTIRPPPHRWALDKQSSHRGLTDIVECRTPLGALPLSPIADHKLFTLLDVCVSCLRRGHANLLCIVPMSTDDPRRESLSPIADHVLRRQQNTWKDTNSWNLVPWITYRANVPIGIMSNNCSLSPIADHVLRRRQVRHVEGHEVRHAHHLLGRILLYTI